MLARARLRNMLTQALIGKTALPQGPRLRIRLRAPGGRRRSHPNARRHPFPPHARPGSRRRRRQSRRPARTPVPAHVALRLRLHVIGSRPRERSLHHRSRGLRSIHNISEGFGACTTVVVVVIKRWRRRPAAIDARDAETAEAVGAGGAEGAHEGYVADGAGAGGKGHVDDGEDDDGDGEADDGYQ